uniref:VOC family protein n=1 Tax=Escherichia coli TaxID=562 RepID=UPI0034DE11C9
MDFNIIRIARTVLNVKDLERSRELYVNALGFIETEWEEEHIKLRGLEEKVHH